MSTKDEKDWLRAILEGKVKPGDAEWERIWKEEDFTGVRRVLREKTSWWRIERKCGGSLSNTGERGGTGGVWLHGVGWLP